MLEHLVVGAAKRAQARRACRRGLARLVAASHVPMEIAPRIELAAAPARADRRDHRAPWRVRLEAAVVVTAAAPGDRLGAFLDEVLLQRSATAGPPARRRRDALHFERVQRFEHKRHRAADALHVELGAADRADERPAIRRLLGQPFGVDAR